MPAGGRVTCRVGEDEGDGASGDVNNRILHSLIHQEGEGVGLSWVAGRLQQRHLEFWNKSLHEKSDDCNACKTCGETFGSATREALLDSVRTPMASATSLVVTSTAWPPEV